MISFSKLLVGITSGFSQEFFIANLLFSNRLLTNYNTLYRLPNGKKSVNS
jgi:hypothetical protein